MSAEVTWCSEQYPEKLGTYIQDFEAGTEFPAYTKQEHTLFYLQVIVLPSHHCPLNFENFHNFLVKAPTRTFTLQTRW